MRNSYVAVGLILTSALVLAQRLPYPTKVVAKKSLINQTAPLPFTAIYTSPVNADLHVSVYMSVGASNCNGSQANVSPDVQWTDEHQLPKDLTLAGALGCGPGQGELEIHVKAGTPVNLLVGYDGGTTNDPYDVYITIVRE